MYEYRDLRSKLFTEEGTVMFMAIRDHVQKLLRDAGACTMGAAMRGTCGDTWTMMACVDRLVELGELREVDPNARVAGQDRVFVGGPS